MAESAPATPKTVLITGGSSGNGLAAAIQFARRGDAVAIVARGRENLDLARTEITRSGGRCLALQADVSDFAALRQAAEQAEQELGPIDVWVNCAAVSSYAFFEQMEMAEFERITAVNYLGVVYGTRIALDKMRPRNRGAIVNIGSVVALQAIPLQAAYVGSKFAVRGFSDAVRTEILNENLKITLSFLILPSLNTPFFDHALNRMAYKPQPVPPVFSAELAGRAILEAADTGKRELAVSNVAVATVIGSLVAPDYLDRKMAERAVGLQQSNERDPGNRPYNLFEPVSTPSGVRGRFSDREKDDHTILETGVIRHALGIGGVALAGLGALAGRMLHRR